MFVLLGNILESIPNIIELHFDFNGCIVVDQVPVEVLESTFNQGFNSEEGIEYSRGADIVETGLDIEDTVGHLFERC